MVKRILVTMLVLTMVIGLAACTPKDPEVQTPPTPTGPDFKIGIMTGTVVQNEEEYRMAEQMKAKYGDMIVTTTYPAQFMSEQETIITNLTAMAADPLVKALVICQAVPGMVAAIEKVRETRPDMLIIAGSPQEDPPTIAARADISLQIDEIYHGLSVVSTAARMGAETLIHYTFPRHMSIELLAARRDLMIEECEKAGIEFVMVEAPDPTKEGGTPATQQFIMENVPIQVAKYGEKTAFFGTNCSMQEPLIKQVIDYGALYPLQCCPSPYHALPAALGISIPDEKRGDVPYILDQIKAKLVDKDAADRVSTWPVPVNMLFIEAGVEYSKAYLEGTITEKADLAKLQTIMSDAAGGYKIDLSKYENFENYFLVLCENLDFSK